MAIALARIDMTKPTLISGKSWKSSPLHKQPAKTALSNDIMAIKFSI